MCRIRSGCCARAANGIATAKPKIALINSRRLMLPARLGTTRLSVKLARGFANVRFGSEADIEACPFDVRFTPESGHQLERYECGCHGFAIEARCNRANGKCKVLGS